MALSPGPYNLSPESYNPVGRLTLDVSHVFWVPPPSIRVNNNLIYFPTPPIQQLPPPIQLAPIRIKDPSISPDSPKIKLPSLRDVFSPNSNLKPVGKFQPMPSSLRDIRPDKEMMGLGMLDMTREPESSAEEMKKVGNYRRISISER